MDGVHDDVMDTMLMTIARFQFLKDVVLVRYVDDSGITTLSSLLLSEKLKLFEHVEDFSTMMESMYASFSTSSEKKRKEMILFSFQLCTFVKDLFYPRRSSAVRALCKLGILNVFPYALKTSEYDVEQAGMEILNTIMKYDPGLIRTHILEADKTQLEEDVMQAIVERYLTSGSYAQLVDASEVLRRLLGTASRIDMTYSEVPLDPNLSTFLAYFYETHLPEILNQFHMENVSFLQVQRHIHSCELVITLLSQAITPDLKYALVTSKCLLSLDAMLTSSYKQLHVAVVRLVTCCILSKDDYLLRYVVKHDVLKPFMTKYFAIYTHDTLLTSLYLHVLDTIRRVSCFCLSKVYRKTSRASLNASSRTFQHSWKPSTLHSSRDSCYGLSRIRTSLMWRQSAHRPHSPVKDGSRPYLTRKPTLTPRMTTMTIYHPHQTPSRCHPNAVDRWTTRTTWILNPQTAASLP
jgi:hypothetical protein